MSKCGLRRIPTTNIKNTMEDAPYAIYIAFGASAPFCTGKKSLNSGGSSSSE